MLILKAAALFIFIVFLSATVMWLGKLTPVRRPELNPTDAQIADPEYLKLLIGNSTAQKKAYNRWRISHNLAYISDTFIPPLAPVVFPPAARIEGGVVALLGFTALIFNRIKSKTRTLTPNSVVSSMDEVVVQGETDCTATPRPVFIPSVPIPIPEPSAKVEQPSILKETTTAAPTPRGEVTPAIEEKAPPAPAIIVERVKNVGLQEAEPTIAAEPEVVPLGKSNDQRYFFKRVGDKWKIGIGEDTKELDETKGIKAVHLLLTKKNSVVPLIQLCQLEGDKLPSDFMPQELVDPKSQAGIATKLIELENELGVCDDPSEIAAINDDIRSLKLEQRSHKGKNGKSRRMKDEYEEARKRIWKRIRDGIKQVSKEMPNLGKHLRKNIDGKGGFWYHSSQDIDWQL